MVLESSLSHDTSVVHADLSMECSQHQEGEVSEYTTYTPLPQIPDEPDTDCAVTVNFPATFAIDVSHSLDYRPEGSLEHCNQSEWTNVPLEHDWAQLPVELQPPSFCVHRCHHVGVERGGEDRAFELPLGFPEVVQYVDEVSEHVCYTCSSE
jgi:hypothetical protein